MAQPDIVNTLGSLQNAINSILIETGRYFHSCSREDTYPSPDGNTKIQTTLRNSMDTFHQALDELETEIILAKASFLHEIEDFKSSQTVTNSHPTLSHENEGGCTINPLSEGITMSKDDDDEIEILSIKDKSRDDLQRKTINNSSSGAHIVLEETHSKLQPGLVAANSGSSIVGIGLDNTIAAVSTVGVHDNSLSVIERSENKTVAPGPSLIAGNMVIDLTVPTGNNQATGPSHAQIFNFGYSNLIDLSQDYKTTSHHIQGDSTEHPSTS
ncbi:hypothetical protein K3495_g172 [Podosphaera aphanis]|nr:hypothetical protein K3495_g172 [Podosphaera aphanis]